jgi:outer membrane biosynthesis protein TonB
MVKIRLGYHPQDVYRHNNYRYLGYFLSIIIHILFFFFLLDFWNKDRVDTRKKEKNHFVTLVKLPKSEKKKFQIVALPDKTDPQPNKNTNLLSEKNSRAELETVARAKSTKAYKNSNIPVKKVSKPKITKRLNDLTGLKIDEFKLAESFTGKVKTGKNINVNSKPKPFSRPSGGSASIYNASGTIDYLPHLKDGELTLLNAKANNYAVFVYRVAARVFADLQNSSWRTVPFLAIKQILRPVAVQVILNNKGKVIEIKQINSSGNLEFDATLRSSASKASDPNPPRSAALNDGNIHLEFQAKAWSELLDSPRGGVRERRWLWLATGLE